MACTDGMKYCLTGLLGATGTYSGPSPLALRLSRSRSRESDETEETLEGVESERSLLRS